MKLNISYLYPDELNLYGDRGNVEILVYLAHARGIDTQVTEIQIGDDIPNNTHLVLMGGGPDAAQELMYEDFLSKKSFMYDFIENAGFGLYICGSYQLLGKYYKSADKSILEGLGVFDFYTEHFGKDKPRCIGNITAKLSPTLLTNELFKNVNTMSDYIVGFENHGGRTYLSDKSLSLGTVTNGFGNNGEDKTEGLLYKNSFGTYMHGPILSRNPHIADFLIAGSLNLHELPAIDNSFNAVLLSAHKSLLKT